MSNPIATLSKKEFLLWVSSLLVVAISNIATGDIDGLTLFAALIGVSAVLFGAKGNIWGQILIGIFSILYGVISFQFHYWGEMITYMGMCFPMAVWALFTWIKNPSEENKDEVKINYLTANAKLIVALSGVVVTGIFYKILVFFNTPNLLFSTLSITTSFYAAALTMLRSSYYAFWYALNDMILIVLWTLASFKNPSYIPVVVNFIVFLINDSYGFVSWKRREKKQK